MVRSARRTTERAKSRSAPSWLSPGTTNWLGRFVRSLQASSASSTARTSSGPTTFSSPGIATSPMTRYRSRWSSSSNSLISSSSASARASPREALASSTSPRRAMRASFFGSRPAPSSVVVPSSPRRGEVRGLALAHVSLLAPEPRTTRHDSPEHPAAQGSASGAPSRACGIAGYPGAPMRGSVRGLDAPTQEQALHLAAQPYRLLVLVDGDVGPPHDLTLRHRVAERDTVGQPDGERPRGRGDLGRHEPAVHGVAALPVQTLAGGEIPLGGRGHVCPEPSRGACRFPPQGRAGDADAELESDQVERTVERRVVPRLVGHEPVLGEAARDVVCCGLERHIHPPAQVTLHRTTVALEAGDDLDCPRVMEAPAVVPGPADRRQLVR